MNNPDTRTISAVHEAGHFVVAEVLGWKIIFATVKYQERGGVVLSERWDYTEPIYVCIIKLAGMAAEKIVFPAIITNAGEHDYESVAHLSAGMAQVAYSRAYRILKQHRARLSQITEALLLHGSINGTLAPATSEDFEISEHIINAESTIDDGLTVV